LTRSNGCVKAAVGAHTVMEDQRNTHFEDAIHALRQHRESASVTGLTRSGTAFFLASVARSWSKPLLVVTPTAEEAERLTSDLHFFLDPPIENGYHPLRVFFLPPQDVAPFEDVAPPVEVSARRAEALYALLTADSPVIVVTTAWGLLQTLPPKQEFNRRVEYLVAGEEVDRDRLLERLVEGGYYRTQLVEERGDFSVRGGVLDIYAPLAQHPVRIEFFGDYVDSMRLFNVLSQRSFQQVDEWVLLPVTEVFHTPEHLARAEERLGHFPSLPHTQRYLEYLKSGRLFPGAQAIPTLFYPDCGFLPDYLPVGSLVALLDPEMLQDQAMRGFREYESRYPNLGDLAPSETWRTMQTKIEAFQKLTLSTLRFGTEESGNGLYSFRSESNLDIKALADSKEKQWEQKRVLVDRVDEWLQMGMDVVWACSTARRAAQLQEFFLQADIQVRRETVPFIPKAKSGAVHIYVGTLSEGFKLWDERIILITDEEFLGTRHVVRRKGKSNVEAFVSSFEDLNPGDFVVHSDHGIGRYRNLIQMEIGGIPGEFLLIEYQGNDRLYIPIYHLKSIQKYVGMEGHEPKLDRLGGKTWVRTKNRVKESVEQIAKELVEIYAARSVRKGFAFSKNNGELSEFAETFEYEETPDQTRAIEEVMADMESPRPMDRLVCGDVGYGKTEVALRAAFKAVLDGKQVCFLVPTTVLAEQHLKTFGDRFRGYPISVDSLSRFKSPREQKEILEKLATGKLDIVVGTHRLLQKDVTFKDLGVLIVDEEQRFGVGHKEKIKQLKKLVDVLTLTATPIPRTLHMSLAGIRDLTTIETPPRDRLSIKTYLVKFDDEVIRAAVTRELRRAGQVFFVHNEVQTIDHMADHLRRLVPEARIGVAHGQLKETRLEEIMLAFLKKELDVLVCSVIIESGLDIPSANTIIINRADRLGLAQMYQLRGRVGRSFERAYAYLLVPGENIITPEAQKRLKALMDFTELGSGFKIAFHDLQIRGGGEILGSSQTGHVAAVGYEMYLELMEKAVHELKGAPGRTEFDPEIHIPVPAFLPETYISSINQRLSLYKRLSSLVDENDIEEMREELKDRFGPLPEPAEYLLGMVDLRNRMRDASILRVDHRNGELVFSFDPESRVNLDALLDFVRKHPRQTRLSPDGRLYLKLPQNVDVMDELKKTLKHLM